MLPSLLLPVPPLPADVDAGGEGSPDFKGLPGVDERSGIRLLNGLLPRYIADEGRFEPNEGRDVIGE